MTKEPLGLTRKTVSIPVSMWEEISDYRFANRITKEAEAIRRLLEVALEIERKKAST